MVTQWSLAEKVEECPLITAVVVLWCFLLCKVGLSYFCPISSPARSKAHLETDLSTTENITSE